MTDGLSAADEARAVKPAGWLTDALRALAEVDQEIAEDGLPAVNASAKNEAERIIHRLAGQPFGPTVYPTVDAEIAIHFKSPDAPDSVVIQLNNDGQGECYACTGGSSRRAHYESSAVLPDGFVLEQLHALTRRRVASASPPPATRASADSPPAGVSSTGGCSRRRGRTGRDPGAGGT